jgi:hypothetical protein
MRGRDCFFYRKIIKLRGRKIAEAAKMSPYFLWRKESIFSAVNYHLRPTNLIALDMPKSIVGCVFIHLGERGIIKTAIDEKFRSLSKKQGGEASVDQIGRLLTNAENADECHVFRTKEEF